MDTQPTQPTVTTEERLAQLEATVQGLVAKLDKFSTANSSPVVAQQEEQKDENSKENEACDVRSRVKIVINKVDPDSNSNNRKDFEVSDGVDINIGKSKDENQHAILLRMFSTSNVSDGSEVEILGWELRRLLKRLLRHIPDHTFLGDTVSFVSPFEHLVFNWDLLDAESRVEVADEDDQRGHDDLRLLLDTLRANSGDEKLDNYFKLRESLKSSQSITFDNLWTIFPPGTLVYSRVFLKQDQIFLVDDNLCCWPEYNERRKHTRWDLKCWTYDWDGKFFQRRRIGLEIEYFEGARPISSLSVHPLKFNDSQEKVERNLLRRGAIFRKYCATLNGNKMFRYRGRCIVDKTGFHEPQKGLLSLFGENQPDRNTGTDDDVTGDVMVDFESYYQYCSSKAKIADKFISEDADEWCECSACMGNEEVRKLVRSAYDRMNGSPHERWDEVQTMLCPPRLLGYVFRKKQWVQLEVDGIDDREVNETGAFWNTLKLAGENDGRETKNLLFGLVKTHGTSEVGQRRYQVDDIVPEKGQGLVILLYGPPGVGKTSTAETIALAARKPLFSIGVSDVGTTAELVEMNLRKIFNLATAWKAILLIDEADVFLQSRSLGQLGPTTERNALVSVFLQVLEYYKGILILTTNQLSQFDIAVQSRIHTPVKYERLDKKQTVGIFCGFLAQYRARDLVTPRTCDEITKYVERELWKNKFDGRQIRNIMMSSMGLAHAEERKLEISDVQDVVNMTTAFKGDLEYQMRKYEEAQASNRV